MDIQQSGAGKPSAVGPAGDIISGGYEAPVPEESAEEQGGSRLGLNNLCKRSSDTNCMYVWQGGDWSGGAADDAVQSYAGPADAGATARHSQPLRHRHAGHRESGATTLIMFSMYVCMYVIELLLSGSVGLISCFIIVFFVFFLVGFVRWQESLPLPCR